LTSLYCPFTHQFISLLSFPTRRSYDLDTYSKGLAGMIRDFVSRKNELPPQDPKEWYDEFAKLSEAGQYFFSTNRYIFRASKAIRDRKSTRLNSSHGSISYAVFCLKKK